MYSHTLPSCFSTELDQVCSVHWGWCSTSSVVVVSLCPRVLSPMDPGPTFLILFCTSPSDPPQADTSPWLCPLLPFLCCVVSCQGTGQESEVSLISTVNSDLIGDASKEPCGIIPRPAWNLECFDQLVMSALRMDGDGLWVPGP